MLWGAGGDGGWPLHLGREGKPVIRRATGGVVLWEFEVFSGVRSLRHCVTGRQGGMSEGRYAALNVGLHVGDDCEAVVENRRRVCRALGVEFEGCTFAQQVHGDRICEVSGGQVGAGRTRFVDGIPETDGLVVAGPGAAVAVVVADCVPMMMYDPERHVGGVVHAGWRGTAAGIAGKAVRFLGERCGSRPEAVLAGVGPAIGPCCYEVSEEVAGKVGVAEVRDGKWYADLAEANRGQLCGAGVRAESIEVAGMCTACHSEEFYSERRLGRPTGRFGAFLALR